MQLKGDKLKTLRYVPFETIAQVGENAFLTLEINKILILIIDLMKLYEQSMLDHEGDIEKVIPKVENLVLKAMKVELKKIWCLKEFYMH